MKNADLADRRQHRLGRPRGRARHVHAGRVRLPRGGPDAHEERGAHRRQERAHLRRVLDRLLGGRLRDRVRRRRTASSGRAASSPRRTRSSRSAPRRSRSSRRSRARPATCSRSSSPASRSRSSGARWPSARSSGSTSSSAPSSRSSTRSSRTGSGTRAAGSSRSGMQDFAGSTVVHYQGALAALAGALLLGPRIGKFGHDGRANPIPGHNMPYAVLGTLILWFGWFGFNPGSTLGVVTGDKIGYFGYVALTTNLAAAAGALGGIGVAWLVLRKPDVSMMLNGVIAALVAITAASGFVAPWAAVVIGAVAGSIAVVGVLWRRADRDRRPDRRRRGARDGRRLGNARDGPLRRPCARVEPRHRHGRPRLHGQLPPARRAGARAGRRRQRSRSRCRSAASGA